MTEQNVSSIPGEKLAEAQDHYHMYQTCLRAQVDALTEHEWQTCEKHGLTFNTRFGCWRCAASNQDTRGDG